MRIVNILAGGPSVRLPRSLKQRPGAWLGVDRGSLRLLQSNIRGLAAVGDFDSVNSKERLAIKRGYDHIYRFKPQKDSTDTELGLQIALAKYRADRVVIYGATGGRVDHFLSNWLMVLEPRFRRFADRIRLVDRQNHIIFYLPGRYQIKPDRHAKYLSFVALTPMRLTLSDVEYPLTNHQVSFSRAYVSNRFLGKRPAKFSFDRGILAVILSRD